MLILVYSSSATPRDTSALLGTLQPDINISVAPALSLERPDSGFL